MLATGTKTGQTGAQRQPGAVIPYGYHLFVSLDRDTKQTLKEDGEMMKSIRNHKYQESISYYTEDIIQCDCGEWIAPGIGDRTGREYDVFFDDARNFVKVTGHNE